MQKLRRVLRYVKGHVHDVLTRTAHVSQGRQVHVTTDANLGGVQDGRSTSGGILRRAGFPISAWSKKTQSTLALGSCEAELTAAGLQSDSSKALGIPAG